LPKALPPAWWCDWRQRGRQGLARRCPDGVGHGGRGAHIGIRRSIQRLFEAGVAQVGHGETFVLRTAVRASLGRLGAALM
jgi:hypothetical protein